MQIFVPNAGIAVTGFWQSKSEKMKTIKIIKGIEIGGKYELLSMIYV